MYAGNQYSEGNYHASKCSILFWGLPGTKLPCTTSLYAHHPSWIFGGFGCAVRWEETQKRGHQSLRSEFQTRKQKHGPAVFRHFLPPSSFPDAPLTLLSKRPRQIESPETDLGANRPPIGTQPPVSVQLHTHTRVCTHKLSPPWCDDSLGISMEMHSVMLCELWKEAPD